MEEKYCVSCKSRISNAVGSVIFNCPSCDKKEIIRCVDCRKKAVKYKCSECEFTGPN